MDMTDIFDTLVQAVEESIYPPSDRRGAYFRHQFCAEQHIQWLEEHLSGEAQAHLEALRRAEFQVEALERDALVRTALALGIRFALPG